MNKFILRINDTLEGFSLEIYEPQKTDIQVLYTSTSWSLTNEQFYKTMRKLDHGKWFKTTQWSPARNNTYAEYISIQQFIPENIK